MSCIQHIAASVEVATKKKKMKKEITFSCLDMCVFTGKYTLKPNTFRFNDNMHKIPNIHTNTHTMCAPSNIIFYMISNSKCILIWMKRMHETANTYFEYKLFENIINLRWAIEEMGGVCELQHDDDDDFHWNVLK